MLTVVELIVRGFMAVEFSTVGLTDIGWTVPGESEIRLVLVVWLEGMGFTWMGAIPMFWPPLLNDPLVEDNMPKFDEELDPDEFGEVELVEPLGELDKFVLVVVLGYVLG